METVHISVGKTKVMVVGKEENEVFLPLFRCEGGEIEFVDKYQYLGLQDRTEDCQSA
jgi:hypothetical protein